MSTSSFQRIVMSLAGTAIIVVIAACSSGNTVNDAEVCSGSQACVCQKDCNKPCTGGNCSFTCKSGATCDFQCKGGNCSVACEGTANCNVACEGGGCNVTGGSGKVKITGCTKGCIIVCDSTNTSCSSSCTDTESGCKNPNATPDASVPSVPGVPTGTPGLPGVDAGGLPGFDAGDFGDIDAGDWN